MKGMNARKSMRRAALTAMALASGGVVLLLSGCEAPPRSEAQQAYDACMTKCGYESGLARGLPAQAYCIPQCEPLARTPKPAQ